MSKKKIPKASKKRLVLLGPLSAIVIVFFVVQFFFYTYKIYDLNKELNHKKKEYNSLKADEKELRTEIDKLQDSDYIARYARENYSYSKNGEYIIKINEEEKKDDEDDNFNFNVNIDYPYIIYGVVIFTVIVIVIKSKKK